MPIKKRSINSQGAYSDYPHLVSNYNDSNINNPSQQANLPTNYELKSITLEDCDRSVYEELNKRFRVGEKQMPLIYGISLKYLQNEVTLRLLIAAIFSRLISVL